MGNLITCLYHLTPICSSQVLAYNNSISASVRNSHFFYELHHHSDKLGSQAFWHLRFGGVQAA